MLNVNPWYGHLITQKNTYKILYLKYSKTEQRLPLNKSSLP
jgi:hypothetical protein